MKIIARGYTHWDPIIAPDPVTVTTVGNVHSYDALVDARSDLWWTLEVRHSRWDRLVAWWQDGPTPTVASRRVGAALAVVAFLIVLGFAGWVEGL